MINNINNNRMPENIPKYASVELGKKINSQTKLPRLPSTGLTTKLRQNVHGGSLNKLSIVSANKSKSNEKNKNLLHVKLQPIKQSEKKIQQKNSTSLQQIRETLNIKKSHRIQRKDSPTKSVEGDIRQSYKDQSKIDIREIEERKEEKKIFNSNEMLTEGTHPSLQPIFHLISPETQSVLVPAKIYDKKSIGDLSGLWWSTVDTLLLTLLKIVKVKKTVESPQKGRRDRIRESDKGKIRESEKIKLKQCQNYMAPPEKGQSKTKIKQSIQLSKVYCNLELEIIQNQKNILKYYEDPNHIALILEALFFEKVLIYLIGSVRKWNHPEEQFHIHNYAVDNLPLVIEIRKLLIENHIEAIDNEVDAKIKRPKYIAREKKLINISKCTNFMKQTLQKCLQELGSPNRYKNFQLITVRDSNTLARIENQWRNLIFDVKLAPYLPISPPSKEYLLVIEPLGILYKYNKKEQTLLINPQTEIFLAELSKYFEIIFFTHVEKEASLLNFMGILDKLQLKGILDRSHLSYREGKGVKNLAKIGTGYSMKKMVVIDDKNHKHYYEGFENSLYLVDSNHTHMKICRVKGKLMRKMEENEDFLKDIGKKLLKCAEGGGNWQQLSD